MKKLILLLLIVSVHGPSVNARPVDENLPDGQNLNEGEVWLIAKLLHLTYPGADSAALRTHCKALFDTANILDQEFSPNTRDLVEKIVAARDRAMRIQRWAESDLDRNDKVDREELERMLLGEKPAQFGELSPLEKRRERIEKRVKELMAADSNGDGFITYDEAVASPNELDRLKYHEFEFPLHLPPDLDANGDGTISRAEFMTTAEEVIGQIDSDGSGSLSKSEARAYQDLYDRAMATLRKPTNSDDSRDQRLP